MRLMRNLRICLLVLPLSMLAMAAHGIGENCADLFDAIETNSFRAVFRMSLQRDPPLGDCKNNVGENAFHIFAKYPRDINMFAALLFLAQVDVNAKNVKGETPLMYTAKYGNYQAAYHFLYSSSVKLERDAQDSLGNTALHYAAMANNAWMASKLIEFGANIDARNNLNQTYLDLFDQYAQEKERQENKAPACVVQEPQIRRYDIADQPISAEYSIN